MGRFHSLAVFRLRERVTVDDDCSAGFTDAFLDDLVVVFVDEPATAGLAVERLGFGVDVESGISSTGEGAMVSSNAQTSRSAVSQSLSSSPVAPLRARNTSYARALIRVCNSAADKGTAGARSLGSATSLFILVDRAAMISSPEKSGALRVSAPGWFNRADCYHEALFHQRKLQASCRWFDGFRRFFPKLRLLNEIDLQKEPFAEADVRLSSNNPVALAAGPTELSTELSDGEPQVHESFSNVKVRLVSQGGRKC